MSAARVVARYAGVPVFVAVVLALWFYAAYSTPLDPIEAPKMTSSYLGGKVIEHIALSGTALVLVLLIAIPLGIALTRPWARRISGPVAAVAGLGLAIPSIGVIVFFATLALIGFTWAVVALVIYAILPVMRNTMVGLQEVDPFVIESAKGMGMSKRQLFWKIEMPLAVPVMLAGVRTALILVVGTAALATFTDGGGLGDVINSGILLFRFTVLYTGALLAASLALLVDYVGGLAEEYLRPKGLR
ncbi:ABC transporter permease [soil metagenome]